MNVQHMWRHDRSERSTVRSATQQQIEEIQQVQMRLAMGLAYSAARKKQLENEIQPPC